MGKFKDQVVLYASIKSKIYYDGPPGNQFLRKPAGIEEASEIKMTSDELALLIQPLGFNITSGSDLQRLLKDKKGWEMAWEKSLFKMSPAVALTILGDCLERAHSDGFS